MLTTPQNHFSQVPDPRRVTRNKLHRLEDIIMITLCAVLCGFEDWVSIEDFAHENEDWLRRFLPLPNGIPSHDTLSDVMGRIDRQAFAAAFAAWVREGLPSLSGRHVAIDGKTVRRSHDGDAPPLHLLSAFATEARLVLAVDALPDKSNEITAIPRLLEQLELAGAIISIDAMGCQKRIAKAIADQKADYVLALKGNHPRLYEDATCWLDAQDRQGRGDRTESVDKDHGRIETRRVLVSTELDWLEERKEWPGLRSLVLVEATRETGGKVSRERRYYLSSLTGAERVAQVIRDHWRIENQQHWILDVQFGEDAHRARKNHSAANLAMVRRAALNLLRQDDSNTLSLRRRKMRALSNLHYREQLLSGGAGLTT